MNSSIRCIFLVCLMSIVQICLADTARETIIKKAIVDSGYLDPEKIYFNPQENLATEGEVFFNSQHLSLNNNVACATCHIPDKASGDGISNAAGIHGEGEGLERLLSGAKIVPRNTLALWGVGSRNFEKFFWDGRVDFSEERPISQFGEAFPSDDPLVTAVHLPVLEIRETVEEDDFIEAHKQENAEGAAAVYAAITKKLYRYEPEAIKELSKKLNKDPEEIEFIDVAASLAAFIRKQFRINSTKFHGFVKGENYLNERELLGAQLFFGKGGCVSCHSGPNFSDFKFHTVPFPQLGFGKNGFGIDYGRYNTTFNPIDLYKFRTPSLYNVDKTSPYGHSGSIYTLKDAIKVHYDPLAVIDISAYSTLQRHEFYKYLANSDTSTKVNFLSEEEVLALVEFLRTLSFD